jgi:hypothetical protein
VVYILDYVSMVLSDIILFAGLLVFNHARVLIREVNSGFAWNRRHICCLNQDVKGATPHWRGGYQLIPQFLNYYYCFLFLTMFDDSSYFIFKNILFILILFILSLKNNLKTENIDVACGYHC